MRPTEMTIQHDVMACPVCGEAIRAEVHILPKLGTPTIDSDRSVTVPVDAEMTRFHVTHQCRGRVEASEERADA